jgi:hypothetical protein
MKFSESQIKGSIILLALLIFFVLLRAYLY